MRTNVSFSHQKVSLELSSSLIKITVSFAYFRKNVKSNERIIMYSVDDIIGFLSSFVNCHLNIDLDSFLLPGLFKYENGFAFVTEVGMKHLFSGLVCFLNAKMLRIENCLKPVFVTWSI